MDDDLSCPDDSAAEPRRWRPEGPQNLLTVINGVLAAVGTVYLSTGSIAVTVVATAAAVYSVAQR